MVKCISVDKNIITLEQGGSAYFPNVGRGEVVSLSFRGLTNPRSTVETEPFKIYNYGYNGNLQQSFQESGSIGGVTMKELADIQFYVNATSNMTGELTTYNFTYLSQEPLLAGDKATLVFPKFNVLPQTLRELNPKSLSGNKDIEYSLQG